MFIDAYVENVSVIFKERQLQCLKAIRNDCQVQVCG
jgi:hypothetical protein